MNSTQQPLHVWIFNDASVADLLIKDSPLWRNRNPAIIVEVSSGPVLAMSHDLETPHGFPGVAGLLGAQTEPSDLTVRLPGCPAPVLLSADGVPVPAVLRAALRALANDTRITGPRVVLVESSLVPMLAHLLAHATTCGIAWDLASPPGSEAVALAESLAKEGILEPGVWSGFLGYFSRGCRPDALEVSTARELLAALPGAELIEPALESEAAA